MYDAGPRYCYEFTGKERDTETGLDYFGARYYASNMGRFLSPDWEIWGNMEIWGQEAVKKLSPVLTTLLRK